MALTENLRRLMGFDQPGNDAEVNIKIKPLTATAAPQTTAPTDTDPNAMNTSVSSDPTAVGAGAGAAGAADGGGAGSPVGIPITPIDPNLPPGVQSQAVSTPTPAPLGGGFGPEGASVVPQGQQVANKNPTLVTHPLGARTDDQYEAAIAQLSHDTQSQYLNTLQELGFMDDTGRFIPGTLETEAVRNRSEINRQRDLTLQNIVENAVRGGTVFSGRRATLQAQGSQPYDAALANLQTVLGRELGKRYQGLGDLNQQFELSRNQLIAQAAERYQNSLLGGPAGGGDSSGGGGTPPAAVGTMPDVFANLGNVPGGGEGLVLWANQQYASQVMSGKLKTKPAGMTAAQWKAIQALVAKQRGTSGGTGVQQ